METLTAFFEGGDFWNIVLKALLTTLITCLIGLVCTSIGKIIAKSKNSKIKKHAEIAVKAAEQKFPNEGTKMGPEKMAYVMDYLAITFPKIKNNQYLYNIAEATVYELNRERELELAKQEFKDKYGELPENIFDKEGNNSTTTPTVNDNNLEGSNDNEIIEENQINNIDNDDNDNDNDKPIINIFKSFASNIALNLKKNKINTEIKQNTNDVEVESTANNNNNKLSNIF